MPSWVWLWACTTAPVDTASDTEPTSESEVDEPETLGEAVCAAGAASEDPYVPRPNDVTGESPFGVGSVQEVVLGPLEDASLLVTTPTGDNVDYDHDLDVETFNLYVPEDYDGSEPYGLLVHIDAGDVGRVAGDWQAALADQRVIAIAANGVGNPEDVDRRMGLSMLGATRALELFHLDEGRIWATGTSGGGRTATMMAFLHPDTFAGAMPLCGSAYVSQVDQDYETQEPDGHYEYWGGSFFPRIDGEPYADFLLAYQQRFALLTSFDDFREGDLFNILHNGFEPGGWDARLLETTGSHCATTPEHAADALAFLQHPVFSHPVDDWWTDGATVDDGVSLEAGGVAVLQARLSWQDAQGLIVRSTWQLDALDGGTVSQRIAAWDEEASLDALAALPAVVLTLDATTVSVQLGDTVVLTGTIAEDEPLADVVMKTALWRDELQVNLGVHLDPDSVVTEGSGMLLHDNRTVRVRLDEMDAPFGDGDFDEGAVLVYDSTGPAAVGDLSITDAVGLACD